MILNNPKYKKFKELESYCLPFSENSLDIAALVAAITILEELKAKSFGIDTESGFQGVVLKNDILNIESELKERLSKFGVDLSVLK